MNLDGVRTAVVGAGYLGRRVATLLRERGSAVTATARSQATIASLRADGLDVLRVDLNEPETFLPLENARAVILCPAPSDASDEGYERIYGRGIPRLCEFLASVPRPPLVLYTSSTSVYPSQEGAWVTEESPVDGARPRPRALLRAEAAVSGLPLLGIVLRLAGIYGPGRNRISALLSGTAPFSPPGDVANLIHVDDAAAAAVFLLERGAPGETYIGVDSAPVPRADFYAWLAAEIGARLPARDDAGPAKARGGPKRCSNRKLLSLGFSLRYPSYRDGYRALIASEASTRP